MHEPTPKVAGVLRTSWTLFLLPLIRAVVVVVAITALVGWLGFRVSNGEPAWRFLGVLPLRADAEARVMRFFFALITLAVFVYGQHVVLIWKYRRRRPSSLSQLARLPEQERIRILERGDE